MISVNGQRVNPTIFPDGTSQVWKLEGALFGGHECRVEWKFESEAELLHLAQLRDLLGTTHLVILLNLTYLPYARQDKPIGNGETFALYSFAKLLNSLHFDRVTCSDPHSSVASQLIHNFKPVYPIDEITRTLELCCADIVCYPDKGALEKYSKILKELQTPFLFGNKEREQTTGRITGYELFGDPTNKRVLIVDDICDGGATFVLLANALRDRGARSVHLFVAHGLFSKGLTVLREAGISRIFTKEGELT